MTDNEMMPAKKILPHIALFLAMFTLAIIYIVREDHHFAIVWGYFSLNRLGKMGRAYWRWVIQDAVVKNDKRLRALEGMFRE